MENLAPSEVKAINQHNKELIQKLNDYLGIEWILEYTYQIVEKRQIKKERRIELFIQYGICAESITPTQHFKFKRLGLAEIDQCIKERLSAIPMLPVFNGWRFFIENFNDGFQRFKQTIELNDRLLCELTSKAKEKTTKIKI